MIPEDDAEAARLAIYKARWVDAFGPQGVIATDEVLAHAALEAAAPHMLAGAPLLTPCCRAPIATSVSGFSGDIEIYCPADGCYRTWNDAGSPS